MNNGPYLAHPFSFPNQICASSLVRPLQLPLQLPREIFEMDSHDTEDPKQSTADMTAFVQNLLQQMQSRFQTMSDSIITKIDEMGSRIDELEQSINDLRAEMGVEGTPSPSKPKDEPKPEDDANYIR